MVASGDVFRAFEYIPAAPTAPADAAISKHPEPSCNIAFDAVHSPRRTFAFSARGGARHYDASFRAGDALLFGPETSGLPDAVLARYPPERRLRTPMRPASRSMNPSNAAAVTCCEAWRQPSFDGQRHPGG